MSIGTVELPCHLRADQRSSVPIGVEPWRRSTTVLVLHNGAGRPIAEARRTIACSGSLRIWPHEIFSAEEIIRAGATGFVLICDKTRRLLGYHGLMATQSGFSLDHMFGF